MKLEIYFDYLCEFCEQGWRYWNELLPLYPQIEPVWRPCEAHPRVTEPRYGMHSDIAIQGMLYLQANGCDVPAYNDAVFTAAWRRGANIEDVKTLAAFAAQAGANSASFIQAIRDRAYLQAQLDANDNAWNVLGMRAAPTYILENGKRIDAALGVGVKKQQLAQFLQNACE